MGYHYGTDTLEALNKVCPGTLYLRKIIKAKALEFGVDKISVLLDGEQVDFWTIGDHGKVKPAQAKAISLWAVEVDDVVRIKFERAGKSAGSLYILYDGPYTKESAAEIVNDYSTNLGELPDE